MILLRIWIWCSDSKITLSWKEIYPEPQLSGLKCNGAQESAIGNVDMSDLCKLSPFKSRWKNLPECVAGVLAQFVGEFHREVQDHVASLLGALGQRQPFSRNALFHSRLDNVSGGHSDGPAIQCGSVDCASTQRLERGRERESKIIRQIKPLMFGQVFIIILPVNIYIFIYIMFEGVRRWEIINGHYHYFLMFNRKNA